MMKRKQVRQEQSMRPPGPTLFDAPFGTVDRLDEGVVGVVGMPTDWTHSSRIGAREGPAALRQATTELCRTQLDALGETVIDPGDRRPFRRADRGTIVDCGDAPIDASSVERTTEAIAAMTEAVRARGAIPLALGGDHYNSFPACLGYARGLATRHPDRRFGYIQIDGHLDLADRLGAWGTHNHATNGRRNSELPNIERANMVWIGITGWVDGDELALIENMGGLIFSSGDVHELGAAEVARRAVAHATRGCENPSLEPPTTSGLTSNRDEPNPPLANTLRRPKCFDDGHTWRRRRFSSWQRLRPVSPVPRPTGSLRVS